MDKSIKALLSFVGLTTALISSGTAWASTLSPVCTADTCTWEMSVNGTSVMSGSYTSDPETGNLFFGGMTITGDGYTISLDSMSGNIDPLLGFGLGATNTSGGLMTYAFSFSLPLGGLSVPIDTYAELGTTLTAFTDAGGSVFATSGTGFIVDSQDIALNPFSSVDKGVDVGAGLSTSSQGTVQNIESATSSILSGGPYDLMSVVVAFGLEDQTGVGFSGFVEQVAVVPVPAAVWLFGTGLIALVGVARRKA